MYFVLKFSQILPTFLATQFHVLFPETANKTKAQGYVWWLIPLVPELGKQTQADLWGWDQTSVDSKFPGPGGRMWSSKEGEMEYNFALLLVAYYVALAILELDV